MHFECGNPDRTQTLARIGKLSHNREEDECAREYLEKSVALYRGIDEQRTRLAKYVAVDDES